MTKLSQFIIRHNIEDGYSVAYTVEQLAKFMRCSESEILSAALINDKAAQYLIKTADKFNK